MEVIREARTYVENDKIAPKDAIVYATMNLCDKHDLDERSPEVRQTMAAASDLYDIL